MHSLEHITKSQSQAEQLSLVLNALPHAILFETASRDIVFVNQQFCDFFHIPLPPEQLFGQSCKESAHQASVLFNQPDVFINDIQQILTASKPVINHEFILANGNSVFLDYLPVLSNNTYSHLWVYKNITEIEHLFRKVNEQRLFYENLLNNLPADIAIFNPDHSYLFVNKNAISSPASREWIIGKTDFDYCQKFGKPFNIAERRTGIFKQAITGGEMVEFEEINTRPEGAPIYNLRRFLPVKNDSGAITQVIGYGINITSIKNREQQLIDRDKEFTNLIDSMDQMVVAVDDNMLISYCNPKWFHVTGKDPEHCIGRQIGLYVKSSRNLFHQNLLSFISSSAYVSDSRKAVISSKDGSKRIIKYYISPFSGTEEKSKRFAVFMTDITDQVTAEKGFKRVAKQERKLNELKTNFMNMVSHELRTPLSVILSNAELIDLSLSRSSGTENQILPYTERIIEQVDRMTLLMNDFLFISKIEAGKIFIKVAVQDMFLLLQQLTKELYYPWKDGRYLTPELKGNNKPVLVDESMMRHILTNILNNALKYSSGKAAPKVRLTFKEHYWTLLVTDEGIGINGKDIKRLFTPFVRGSNVGDVEGTGLGLLVVKYFVNMHKGIIQIKSSLNRGTAILIKFPY